MDGKTPVVILALVWVVSTAATFLTRRYAIALGLLDAPNQRSSHSVPTPNGGGIGFVLAGSLAMFLLPAPGGELWACLLLSLLIAAVGLRDDIRHVPVSVRFLVQILAITGALISLGAVQSAPLLAMVVLLGGIWWVNLFNFMDGIDGIAGTQALFMLVAAALFAFLRQPDIGASAEWMWMLAIAAAIAGFLMFNWPPATIFMGDVGSTWLAFVIFVLAVVSVRDGWLNVPCWLILGGVFIADSTTTLFRRMVRGARWSQAHRSHAYQRLARRLNSHRPVTLLVVAINALWLAPCAWAAHAWPEWSWFLTALAYAPLTTASLSVGAGSTRD